MSQVVTIKTKRPYEAFRHVVPEIAETIRILKGSVGGHSDLATRKTEFYLISDANGEGVYIELDREELQARLAHYYA